MIFQHRAENTDTFSELCCTIPALQTNVHYCFFVCICTKPVCIILFWKTVANFTNYLFFFTTRINRWMIALSNVAVICWTKTDFCYCCCPFCFVLLSTEKKQHMKKIKNLSNKVFGLVVFGSIYITCSVTYRRLLILDAFNLWSDFLSLSLSHTHL